MVFPRTTLEAMHRVAEAERANFVELVELSGLDPEGDFRFANLRGVDLRGCDLRGFDFTFADLTGAIVSNSTRLPNDKVPDELMEVLVVAEDEKPIALVMKEIASAPEAKRGQLLEKLHVEYDSPVNIGEFCLNLLKKTRSPKHALQYISAMDEEFINRRRGGIVTEIIRVLDIHSRKAMPRKKVFAANESVEAHQLLEIIEAIGDRETSEVAGEHKRSSRTLFETVAILLRRSTRA